MVSMRANELSSTGSEAQTSLTGANGKETRVAKSPSNSGQSTKSTTSTPTGLDDFCVTLEEHLPILQEDLRVLRLLGGKFRIIESLPPTNQTVIVFDNVGFRAGDFYLKDEKVVAESESRGNKVVAA